MQVHLEVSCGAACVQARIECCVAHYTDVLRPRDSISAGRVDDSISGGSGDAADGGAIVHAAAATSAALARWWWRWGGQACCQAQLRRGLLTEPELFLNDLQPSLGCA